MCIRDRLTVPSGQATTFANFTSDGGIFYGNNSGVLQQVTAGTNTQCLLGGATPTFGSCLLYTSDAADDLLCVDLGGRRILKKKKQNNKDRHHATEQQLT